MYQPIVAGIEISLQSEWGQSVSAHFRSTWHGKGLLLDTHKGRGPTWADTQELYPGKLMSCASLVPGISFLGCAPSTQQAYSLYTASPPHPPNTCTSTTLSAPAPLPASPLAGQHTHKLVAQALVLAKQEPDLTTTNTDVAGRHVCLGANVPAGKGAVCVCVWGCQQQQQQNFDAMLRFSSDAADSQQHCLFVLQKQQAFATALINSTQAPRQQHTGPSTTATLQHIHTPAQLCHEALAEAHDLIVRLALGVKVTATLQPAQPAIVQQQRRTPISAVCSVVFARREAIAAGHGPGTSQACATMWVEA